MNCWTCRRAAVGICKFCGRGTCENHVETHPYLVELFKGTDVMKAIVVEDALYCGKCYPRPDPIDLPELDVT